MKILSIVVALILVGGGGYMMGKNAGGVGVDDKALQDSITMMKEQSMSIQKMATMMESNGALMQKFGVRYNNDEMMMGGKDMEVMAEKYMQASKSASSEEGVMGRMMGR